MLNIGKRPLIIAFNICLTIAIVMSGLFICINARGLVHLYSSAFSTYSLTTYTHEQVAESAVLTRDFSVGKSNYEQLREKLSEIGIDADDLDSNMIDHLAECTPIFKTISCIEIASILLSIALFLLIKAKCELETLLKNIRLDCKISLSILFILLLLMVTNFDVIFENMHKLLFTGGNWSFAYDSLLICMYPEKFWIAMGATLCIIPIAISVIGIILSHKSLRMA